MNCHSCHLCQFDIDSALRLAKLLIGGFADSKVVEDTHQACRVAVNPGASQKLSGASLQLMCQMSDVLEKRGIQHPTQLSREVFLDKFPDTKDDFNCRTEFKVSAHHLDPCYSQILTKKTRRTVSEDTLRVAYGGRRWLLSYCGGLAERGVHIEAGPSNLVF